MTRISEFTVDISPLAFQRLTKEQQLQLMKKILCATFPGVFLYRGREKKILTLALEIYSDYIVGMEPGSNIDYARKLSWKAGAQGKVSYYFKELEGIGFTRARQFNEGFLSNLSFISVNHLNFSRKLLEDTKLLLSSHFDQRFDLIPEAGLGYECNEGQLMNALISILEKSSECEEVYLLVRKGSTWGSEGIGEFMRLMLQRAVSEKKMVIRVASTSEMKERTRSFFEQIGEITIVSDGSLKEYLGNLRFFYIAGYIITVVKSDNSRAAKIKGTIRKDFFNEKDRIKQLFETAKSSGTWVFRDAA